MTKALLVTSSVMGELSMSRQIAMEFLDKLSSEVADLELTVRDTTLLPMLNLSYLSGLRTPVAEMSEQQKKSMAFGDEILEEVESASVVVITAPMYCYTIPAALKLWIEYLNRPGRAFEHGPDGAVGLLTGKHVYVVLTRGSEFDANDPENFQENLIEGLLHSFGLTPVNIVLSEGMAYEGAKQACVRAKARAVELSNELVKKITK